MERSGIERKLTVILSADVAGYSRLMGEDEEMTLRTLMSYREVIDELIGQHRGFDRDGMQTCYGSDSTTSRRRYATTSTR